MDWRPNQDAALYFTGEILPRIRKKHPRAAFTIVGRTPPQHIQDLGKIDGVTVTGTVDDVRPWVGRAAALVVPLRIGGGSRLKILEGMAMHKPIVSTSIGAEGLRVTDNHDILLADNPDTFADAVVRCLSDSALRNRLGDNGRKLVEQEYRWDILARKMHEYLCRVLIGN
jgi:glycosyltransferase involved in cell wall biosynthesis